jgi:hypothetical protein
MATYGSDEETMQNPNSWIEQVYQYVEYYYGTPNDLGKQSIPGRTGRAEQDRVKTKMRHSEVPLNAILNISLCLLPSRIINRLLNCFLVDRVVDFGRKFEMVDISNWTDPARIRNFTQPDVALESDESRVFIELKVNARFTLSQVQKYLALHTLWEKKDGPGKQPYLFFLSPQDFYHQWDRKSPTKLREGSELQDLHEHLRPIHLPGKLGNLEITADLRQNIAQTLERLTLGSATWQSIGQRLQSEIDGSTNAVLGNTDDTASKLISDLLNDLGNRKLWMRKQSGL